jgi:hypothetical protein
MGGVVGGPIDESKRKEVSKAWSGMISKDLLLNIL